MKRYLSPLVGAALLVVFTVIAATGVISRWDRSLWDFYTRATATRFHPDRQIVLVAIDQGSMDFVRDELKVLWPWPRDFWGRLVQVARDAGASMVLFDIMMEDPGIDRVNSSGAASDAFFAQTFAGKMPVILAAKLEPGESGDSIPPGLRWDGPVFPAKEMDGFAPVLPYERFRDTWMGIVNVEPDDDGINRSMHLLYRTKDGILPVLAAQAARITGELEPARVRLDGKGQVRMRYYGPGGPGVFPYYGAAALILGQVPPDSLKGRILIVGAYAPGLQDYVTTPLTRSDRPFPGFELHATLLSNILRGDSLLPLATPLVAAITLLLGVICIVLVWKGRNVVLQAGVPLLLVFLLIGAGAAAFVRGWLFPVASTGVPVYLALAVQMYISWATEGRDKKRLYRLFSRYLDGSVIDRMVDSPEEISMEGEERDVVVMFGDFVGFTSISESLSPRDVVSTLNDYFGEVVTIILNNGGLLDKYVGDCVMVLFGAPLRDEHRWERAAVSVLEALDSVEKLSARREKNGLPTLDMRMGLHFDKVIVGNIGHPKRMDYTAIGSGVNIASRLEAATRRFGTRNLVSEAFAEHLPATFQKRSLGRVVLKGLSKPQTVYELIRGSEGGRWVDIWNGAWNHWKAGRRSEAISDWRSLKKIRPMDPAIDILIKRLEPYIEGNEENDDVLVLHAK